MSYHTVPGSISDIWREIEKIQAVRVSEDDNRKIRYCAKVLAELSGQKVDVVFRRIKPRSEEELGNIRTLFAKCQGHSLEELGDDPCFSEVFMNFHPKSYQLKFLVSQAKQETMLWTRQGGKTTSEGVKFFKRRVRRPGTQATVTAPGLRQSKLVIEKLSDTIYNMDAVARRAWVEKVLRTAIRLHNRSKLKAFPFSLDKLRGETSDDVIIAEAAFIKELEELVQGTLMPQMATRWDKGSIICLDSTPWDKKSYYYKTLNVPEVSQFWTPFIADYRQAVDEGLISKEFIELQKRQLDPDRFSREYELQFTEDHGRWLSQELITACVDHSIVEPWLFEDSFNDLDFCAGLDVGQQNDNAALSVIELQGEVRILRYSYLFPLGTPYDVLTAHLKVMTDRWQIRRTLVDATNERALAETMTKEIDGVEGVAFTQPWKQKAAGFLKQLMSKKQFRYYFEPEVVAGLAVEQFEALTGKPQAEDESEENKEQGELEGNIRFYHAPGTHDDRFWSICLAAAASIEEEPEPFLAVIPR
jgi:phage FluMu gp28-like protein